LRRVTRTLFRIAFCVAMYHAWTFLGTPFVATLSTK